MRYFRCFVLFLCATCFGIQAKILETAHIEEVIPYIDDKTWFLVDLDNCLFQGAQALGHANWFYDEIRERMQHGMSRDEAIADFYPSWVKTQKITRVIPLESLFVSSLLMLQNQGITVMGLTHRQPLIADSTLNQVASLGLNFLKTAPHQEGLEIPANTPTLYSQGILFVGDYNKKIDIFELFLKAIAKAPTKIVFIDDKRKNVEELEKLTQYGIEYIGVHYTAIDHVKPVYDRQIARFQHQLMDQILNNDQALILMRTGSD